MEQLHDKYECFLDYDGVHGNSTHPEGYKKIKVRRSRYTGGGGGGGGDRIAIDVSFRLMSTVHLPAP